MSVVTDILLCTALYDGGGDDEHPNADALSAWLVGRHGPLCALHQLDQLAHGNKAMQADVFGVAVNYCDIDGLVAAFRSIKWERPDSAQLLLKHEDWSAFRVFTVAGGS
jgi:hypothetical protein